MRSAFYEAPKPSLTAGTKHCCFCSEDWFIVYPARSTRKYVCMTCGVEQDFDE